MEIIGTIAGITLSISFGIAYAPQIFRMFKLKSARDISVSSILLNLSGYLSGLTYVAVNQLSDNVWLVVNYSTGCIMTLATLYAWFRYSK